MRKALAGLLIGLFGLWVCITLAGAFLLPGHLLNAPQPPRTEQERSERRARLQGPGDHWTRHDLRGGEGLDLELWWLHRPNATGAVLYLHGFGDDAYGTLGYAESLPEWDALGFTFRGRDRHPERPSTLGAWERFDVTAVVAFLEGQGIPRNRILLVGVSQGAGVALLALAELERKAGPLAGALLESPYLDLAEAAKNHVRGTLGGWEVLLRGAEALALEAAGAHAHFTPSEVSPWKAAQGLRTPIALLAGDSDVITPLSGVQLIAQTHPDLTVVPGARHCEAGAKVAGGWGRWAEARIQAWGLTQEGAISSSASASAARSSPRP